MKSKTKKFIVEVADEQYKPLLEKHGFKNGTFGKNEGLSGSLGAEVIGVIEINKENYHDLYAHFESASSLNNDNIRDPKDDDSRSKFITSYTDDMVQRNWENSFNSLPKLCYPYNNEVDTLDGRGRLKALKKAIRENADVSMLAIVLGNSDKSPFTKCQIATKGVAYNNKNKKALSASREDNVRVVGIAIKEKELEYSESVVRDYIRDDLEVSALKEITNIWTLVKGCQEAKQSPPAVLGQNGKYTAKDYCLYHRKMKVSDKVLVSASNVHNQTTFNYRLLQKLAEYKSGKKFTPIDIIIHVTGTKTINAITYTKAIVNMIEELNELRKQWSCVMGNLPKKLFNVKGVVPQLPKHDEKYYDKGKLVPLGKISKGLKVE